MTGLRDLVQECRDWNALTPRVQCTFPASANADPNAEQTPGYDAAMRGAKGARSGATGRFHERVLTRFDMDEVTQLLEEWAQMGSRISRPAGNNRLLGSLVHLVLDS